KLTGHQGWVGRIALTPDGSLLLSSGPDRLLRLWDANALKELAVLDGHQTGGPAPAISPHGGRAASARSQRLMLWNLRTRKGVQTSVVKDVTALAFTPDGNHVLTVKPGDNDLTVWSGHTLKEVGRREADGWFNGGLQFTRDGKHLIGKGDQG